MYYIYMLRCKDNSIYTGITTDLERRVQEHVSKKEKCAKYTYYHDVIKLERAWKTQNRALASKLEYHIKVLSKIRKEELIVDNNNFEKLLSNKIECDKYENVKIV
ncbi:MAG: GIY-YIG nuclease family protein [Clostridia bacterium]|jgi:putative endonuclease|nr:GIY-YIG nuclease family protein [Clostridia bacterium]